MSHAGHLALFFLVGALGVSLLVALWYGGRAAWRWWRLLVVLLVAWPAQATPFPPLMHDVITFPTIADPGVEVAQLDPAPAALPAAVPVSLPAPVAAAVPAAAVNPALPLIPAACTECARQLLVTSTARGWPTWAPWALAGGLVVLGGLDQLHAFGVIK